MCLLTRFLLLRLKWSVPQPIEFKGLTSLHFLESCFSREVDKLNFELAARLTSTPESRCDLVSSFLSSAAESFELLTSSPLLLVSEMALTLNSFSCKPFSAAFQWKAVSAGRRGTWRELHKPRRTVVGRRLAGAPGQACLPVGGRTLLGLCLGVPSKAQPGKSCSYALFLGLRRFDL